RHRRLDTEQLEVLQVPRVVAARDDPLDAVLLARHLADQDVVLVVAGDGDQHLAPLYACPLHHPELGAVAVLRLVLELLLDGGESPRVLPAQRDLVALGAQLATKVQADLAGPDDDHVHQPTSTGSLSPMTAPSSISIAFCVGHTVDSPCSSYHCARIGSR